MALRAIFVGLSSFYQSVWFGVSVIALIVASIICQDGEATISETCKWRKWHEILLDPKFSHEMISHDMLGKLKSIFKHHVRKGETAERHAANTLTYVHDHCHAKNTTVAQLHDTRSHLMQKLGEDDESGVQLDAKAQQLAEALDRWKQIEAKDVAKIQGYKTEIEEQQAAANSDSTKIKELKHLVEVAEEQLAGIRGNGEDETVLAESQNDWNQLGVSYTYAKDFEQLKTTTEELEAEMAALMSCMDVQGKMTAFAAHVRDEVERTRAIYTKLNDLYQQTEYA